MATLLAITYPEEDRAGQAMESVNWIDFDRLVDVKGACWVSKDEEGVKVHPRSQHVAGKGAAGGALGLLVGGLFGLPVIGLAAGAAAGIHRARQRDDGIDDAFVAAVGEQLESGGSAIFVLFEEGASTAKAARQLARFGGTAHSSDLPSDRLARFQTMLDQANPDSLRTAGDGSSA
jgi:uncharacterized membrane protein